MKIDEIHATLVLLCNSGKSLHVTQQTLTQGRIFWSGTQQASSLIKILTPPGEISLPIWILMMDFINLPFIIKLDSVLAINSL